MEEAFFFAENLYEIGNTYWTKNYIIPYVICIIMTNSKAQTKAYMEEAWNNIKYWWSSLG